MIGNIFENIHNGRIIKIVDDYTSDTGHCYWKGVTVNDSYNWNYFSDSDLEKHWKPVSVVGEEE